MSNFDDFVKNLLNDLEKTDNNLFNKIKSLVEKIKDHEFNAESEMCKECKSFNDCRINASMIQKINNSVFINEVKEELIDFVDWIQHERKLIKVFNIEFIMEDKDFKLYFVIGRFKDCDKYLDKLVIILDESELQYIRKTIQLVNNKIVELFDTITNNNRTEMNNLINKLQKPQQEAKRYEDMTREELLEELKKK